MVVSLNSRLESNKEEKEGPQTAGVHRGLEMKDLRDLNDLTIRDVKPRSDE